ncbi:MAG: hypothetical protein OT643_14210 [Bacteroidetes bacterium]|jgi:hypothetical protein|nr:hypothetical protein [Bacteroidota bacterium]
MKNFFLNFVGLTSTTAQQPNSPTAQQPKKFKNCKGNAYGFAIYN